MLPACDLAPAACGVLRKGGGEAPTLAAPSWPPGAIPAPGGARRRRARAAAFTHAERR